MGLAHKAKGESEMANTANKQQRELANMTMIMPVTKGECDPGKSIRFCDLIALTFDSANLANLLQIDQG